MDGDRKQRWLKRAEAAYQRMFDSGELTTLTEREDVACLIAKELAAFLIEEHLAGDAQVRPAKEQPPACPKCQKAGQRVTRPKEKLPERPMTTRAGEVVLRREQWHCPHCRVLFFSARPQAETRHRGVQPAVAAARHAAGGQSVVVSGRQ